MAAGARGVQVTIRGRASACRAGRHRLMDDTDFKSEQLATIWQARWHQLQRSWGMIVGVVGRWFRQSTTTVWRLGGDDERPANPSPRIRQSSNDGDGGGANPSCTKSGRGDGAAAAKRQWQTLLSQGKKTFPSSRGTFFSKKLLDCKKSTFCLLFRSLPLFVGKKGG